MKTRDDVIILLSTIGSLILLNILAQDWFFRVDLTSDGRFTLAEPSRTTMEELEDQVTVTAYFSSDLPAQFEGNRRYLKDLLDEYRAASKGMLAYEFIDPEDMESEEDREKKKVPKRSIFGAPVYEPSSVDLELEQLGVRFVEMNVIENDKEVSKRGYMGVVIRYQEDTEVIPVVQATTGLEYNLTTMIRKLVRTRVPVVGVTQGKGEPGLDEKLTRLKMLLSQNYEVRPVEVKADTPIDDVDALFVIGNRQAYSPDELARIDDFVASGKSAAFFLDVMNVDFAEFNPQKVAHGFDALLSAWGIDVGDQLVADAECEALRIPERRGIFIIQNQVRYPFIPRLSALNQENPVSRGITDVVVPFPAPLFFKDIDGVKHETLASSSDKSWLEDADPAKMVPNRDWNAEEILLTGPYPLVATASGRLPRAFGDGVAAPAEGSPESRVVVSSSSGFAIDDFMGRTGAAFLLNLADWMLVDPAFVEMRSRGLSEPPLAKDINDSTRLGVKYGNVVGVPLLLALYGLVRWQMRRARRRQLMSSAR